MDSSKDTEITLGTAKLLGLFFGLVAVCAVFFALGYSLGRKSDTSTTVTNAATSLSVSANGSKPASASSNPPPMSFYKAVEQKDANAQLSPATATDAPPATGAHESSAAGNSAAAAQSNTSNPPDPMSLSTSTYLVQVAAVSKEDDAQALVDALKKKQYPAFVASNISVDKLFRVQVGPFGDIKEAEATRARLVNDGYSPILKK